MAGQIQNGTQEQGKVCVTRAQGVDVLFQRRVLLSTDDVIAARATGKINAKAIDAVHGGNKSELVRLLKAGAGKGAVDNTSNTLIAIVGWNGKLDIARILLQHDAKKGELFTKEELIIAHYYATRAGHTNVAELIKLYADEKV